jgi:N-acetylmuramic acid 6-phosphate etherase
MKATNDKLRDRACRIICTVTGLPRPEAFVLLRDSGWECKVAIARHKLGGIGSKEARSQLALHEGSLAGVLHEGVEDGHSVAVGVDHADP